MRSVAVLRCGNRRGPHPRRFYTRPVRIAGHATDGTDELPGTFAPQCRLAVQLSTQANGRHERMHLTLKKEATKPAAANFLQQQARFDKFMEIFNHERPHEALDMKCPAEVYPPSPRPYTGLPDIDYPFHDKTIVVTRCGRICLGNKKINFSQVFAGQAVGIKEVHDDIWLVSFMDYDLGYFDLDTRVLEPLENPFGPKVSPM
jgi:putative transposase